MLLFLVRLALALQSLDGCQDLIKLITAVSQCRGFGNPHPRLLPTSPLHPKDPAGKERRESLSTDQERRNAPFLILGLGSGKRGMHKNVVAFLNFMSTLFFN